MHGHENFYYLCPEPRKETFKNKIIYKVMALKLINNTPDYNAPEVYILTIQAETVFLGSTTPSGNIPTLVEGDVPEDLWG